MPRYSDEVAEALAAGRPVVALESTVIAHGLPRPENERLALELEDEVRRAGAVPATVALLDGEVRVGLGREEIARLAGAAGGGADGAEGVAKASLRDLPVLVARRGAGATTVAATAVIAARAGIDVFVTGGIGGVHRQAPVVPAAGAAPVGGSPPGGSPVGGPGLLFDVSADLTALAGATVAVVCAGAKTVLDVANTRELLETLGVTVLGWRTDRLPGFLVRETPYRVDARVEDAAEAAAVYLARRELGLPGAVLVAVPVPAAAALPEARVEQVLAEALAELGRAGVAGRDVTPFLLARLREATGGAALAANLALLRQNARVGAELAGAIAARRRRGSGGGGGDRP